jgi:hypothetical protein
MAEVLPYVSNSGREVHSASCSIRDEVSDVLWDIDHFFTICSFSGDLGVRRDLKRGILGAHDMPVKSINLEKLVIECFDQCESG